MRLMHLLSGHLGSQWRRIADAADEIVSVARGQATDTVSAALVHPMSLSEARGYVRSRSRLLVRRRMAQVLGQRNLVLSPAQQEHLLAAALERVTSRVLDRVEYGRAVAHLAHRRAA